MRPANLVGGLVEDRFDEAGARRSDAFEPSAAAPLIGGRYRLGTRIGAGGEGETFRALDVTTGDTRALKIFRNLSPESVARVQAEFQRLIRIDHPGVVRGFDLGRHDGRLFLVTELVSGESIASIAAIPDDDRRRFLFIRAATQVADALGYLHARGIVHGDVSPENVRVAEDGRAVLIDFGASGLQSTGGAVGTLGFAAPEALVGLVTPASDLFGLGATLFAAWTASGPFGVGADSVVRMLAAPAPALSAVRAGLPGAWDDLIARLLALEPERRWGSARVVLREIGRLHEGSVPSDTELLPPHPAGDPLAGIVVGRVAERALLKREFERVADGVASCAAIALIGAAGSGRHTLMDVSLRDLAISQVAEPEPRVSIFRGSYFSLLAWLGLSVEPEPIAGEDDPLQARQRAFSRTALGLDKRAAEHPLIVALVGGAEDRAFASFVAGATGSGRCLILIPCAAPLERVGAQDVALPPLAPADVQALVARATGDDPSETMVARIVAAGAGHAATIAILARQAVEAVRRGDADQFRPGHDAALDQLLDHSFAGLPRFVRRYLAAVALGLDDDCLDDGAHDGPRDGDHDRKTGAGIGEGTTDAVSVARAAGWIVEGGGRTRLPSPAHEAVLRRALGEPDLRDVARAALESVTHSEPQIRGICLEALGEREQAALAFRSAAEDALLDGRKEASEDASRWFEEAVRLDSSSLGVDQVIFLATSMAWQGRGEGALRLLDGALISKDAARPDAADHLRLVERKAWLLGRAGQLTSARRLLEAALAHVTTDVPPDVIELPRARLARVLVSMGCFAEAVDAATPTPLGPVAGALAIESALLALAYRGDLEAARRLFAADGARSLPPVRASYMAALLDHLAGDLQPALDAYRRSLPEAESSGDIHTLAAIALNMGALAAEAGRHGEALVMQDRAIRELGRLGATSELGVALFNAGMLLIEIGDLAGARRIVACVRRDGSGRSPMSTEAVTYLEAELALRDGDEPRALDLFTQAGNGEAAGLDGLVGRAARIARAELLARCQHVAEANTILDALVSSGPSPRTASDVRLARAKVLLAGPVADVDAALRTASDLDADAERAAQEGRRPRAWRAKLTAARLFHRAGRTTEASVCVAAARRLFEEIRMSTPIDHQAGLEQDPDARFLADLSRRTEPDENGSAGLRAVRASRAEDRLRRLLRINKRLNSELRLPRLLELIMDTVIELTEAERGFILLEDEKQELTVKVARNIDQQTLQTGAFELSRSIAQKAATGGTPIVTIDAAGDPRFREALSVSDLHLRSVLAVPLQVKGRAVGTLYVDNRLRKGAFGDDDVQLVLDFAEQAGIAIENARLLAELRRRERQIEVLNRRLQGELAVRREEMVGMKQELRENREALAIRYDYRNIIGRTPRMLELFRLLDRLTDTALPVVIQGESGTGKELVARALHFNGPRRDRPFVSENCAAIPETLLESTLFGAVRGAYTGADHDTRGLFEVADGGTLFLDEVAEMSPGMQGKLLRVLQTGELRRVGSERTRKVDVRVIAATNRDLGRMVEEGRFRQDLFFRLSVAPIALPPLRDRREDIPAIVAHILANMAATGKTATVPKRVTPAAMSRLGAYRWPGNVRELENELMRAAAMSDEHIGVGDLSRHVAGDAETAFTTLEDPDSLALRPRVERLERALLREALSRSGGNQTRAAVALGLSRFGLQKKLHRYQMG